MIIRDVMVNIAAEIVIRLNGGVIFTYWSNYVAGAALIGKCTIRWLATFRPKN
jgi:hypothetical protein